MVACDHRGIVYDRLVLADSLMAVYPDSAFSILDTLDSSDQPRGVQAWHALLFTKANEKNIPALP